MDIQVNGKKESFPAGSTVKTVLERKELDPALVSVEHNGKILERPELESTALTEGDEIEVLFFMGGGARSSYRWRQGWQ